MHSENVRLESTVLAYKVTYEVSKYTDATVRTCTCTYTRVCIRERTVSILIFRCQTFCWPSPRGITPDIQCWVNSIENENELSPLIRFRMTFPIDRPDYPWYRNKRSHCYQRGNAPTLSRFHFGWLLFASAWTLHSATRDSNKFGMCFYWWNVCAVYYKVDAWSLQFLLRPTSA